MKRARERTERGLAQLGEGQLHKKERGELRRKERAKCGVRARCQCQRADGLFPWFLRVGPTRKIFRRGRRPRETTANHGEASDLAKRRQSTARQATSRNGGKQRRGRRPCETAANNGEAGDFSRNHFYAFFWGPRAATASTGRWERKEKSSSRARLSACYSRRLSLDL